MNEAILSGRLTREPYVIINEDPSRTTALYTLAINHGKNVDYIDCVAFGRSADWALANLHKGMRIEISGRVHSCRYTDRSGNAVRKTEIIVSRQEYGEAKRRSVLEEYNRLRALVEGEDLQEMQSEG